MTDNNELVRKVAQAIIDSLNKDSNDQWDMAVPEGWWHQAEAALAVIQPEIQKRDEIIEQLKVKFITYSTDVIVRQEIFISEIRAALKATKEQGGGV